jgi:TRAP-type transport system small permease protein
MKLFAFDKALRNVERWSAYVAAGLVFIMIFPTTIDVFLRYIMDEPLPAMFQLTEFMMIGVVYLGISYVQSSKGHIIIEVMTQWLPQKGQDILDIVGYFLGFVIFMAIAWQTGKQGWDAWVTQDYTMGIVHFPLWPAKSIIPLGCALLCIRLLVDMAMDIQKLLNPAAGGTVNGR